MDLYGHESDQVDQVEESFLLNVKQFKNAARKRHSRVFAVKLVEEQVKSKGPGGDVQLEPRVKSLVEAYQDLFAELPPGLPPMRNIGHTIDTGDNPPISKPAYRLSPKEKAEVER